MLVVFKLGEMCLLPVTMFRHI